MEITNTKTTTYALNAWRFDFVELNDAWEAWLYRVDTGIKTLVFGCPKIDQYGDTITLDDMVANVDLIKQDYMRDYLSEYCDVNIVWED